MSQKGTAPQTVNVLLVDDQIANLELLEAVLENPGYNLVMADRGKKALALMEEADFAVVLLDVMMPEMDGFVTAQKIRESNRGANTPIIFVTASADTMQNVSRAYKLKAVDYILKPFDHEVVRTKVAVLAELHRKTAQAQRQAELLSQSEIRLEKKVKERTAQLKEANKALKIEMAERLKAEDALKKVLQEESESLRKENTRLKSTFEERYKFGKIVGKSKSMQEVYDIILRAASSNANVIVYGESGTGKELVSMAIHEMSDRAHKDLLTVNCGAIPSHLLESEFFGYKKGAFTGATTDKRGFLDLADGGTLFLDEVGEIDLNIQVKLLRAVEGKGFTPVGGTEVKKPDVRIVAATNRDLKELVLKGVMREDFYYRVHIIPIYLPPLRERKDDLPLLVYHFLQEFGDGEKVPYIPGRVMDAMLGYDWPGNVRELQNVLRRYVTLGKLDFAGAPQVSFSQKHNDEVFFPTDAPVKLAEAVSGFEKKFIIHALKQHDENRTRTAKALGIERRTLQKKIKLHNLAG